MVAVSCIDLVPKKLAAQRILTNQEGAELAHHRGIDACRTVTFAPADQTLIGLDLDDQRGPFRIPGPRVGERLGERCFQHMGADTDDLHALIFLTECAMWEP